MNTAIIITAIVCGTIIVLALLSTIDKAIVAKKTHDDITKLFKEEK